MNEFVEVHTVGELRKQLEHYSDACRIECQTVGEESGVWSVYLGVGHGEKCGWKWDEGPALFRLSHPMLKSLMTTEEVEKCLSQRLREMADELAKKGL